MYQLTKQDYCKLNGEEGFVEANFLELKRRVDGVLTEFQQRLMGRALPNDQISGNPVASGQRNEGSNARTQNAAKGSTHLTSEGVDMQDYIGTRDFAIFLIKNDGAMLRKYDLYMEDPRWTAGKTNSDPWCHLQTRRPGSGRRVYVPYQDIVKYPPQSPDFYKHFGLTVPT